MSNRRSFFTALAAVSGALAVPTAALAAGAVAARPRREDEPDWEKNMPPGQTANKLMLLTRTAEDVVHKTTVDFGHDGRLWARMPDGQWRRFALEDAV